jgi:hypothetical protein
MSEDRRDDQLNDDDSEGFLSRWSQRKAMARDGIELPDEPELPEQLPVVDATGIDNAPAKVEPAAGDAEPRTELPPLESLDENSDYSAFLNKDVSPDLRQKALRKLFQSPKFNVRDGLDDYDLDFSNPEPLGDIVTAEMRYRIKAELERLARRELEGDASDETAIADVASDGDAELAAPDYNEEIAEDDIDEQPLTS